ncbi:MFS transporter [Amycolatopsis sp.]|uniref:MFS transporter n=1 Tax=Amycolatopsis sp. TaxID=37632 RepID=UPI002E028C78|nr:MFS transporter [Amycolatopsis sp.]
MPGRRWYVLSLLGTAFFMTILDGTSLLTALPSIERDLGLDGPGIQWTVTVYALAFSGPLLFCGRAADLLGRRRVFLVGMVLRVVASLLCGLAPSVELLVAARALQGFSVAIIAPAALSMVMNVFSEGTERNKALGIWGGLGGIGATAGLLLGGVVTEGLGWQWVFWINVPIGLFVLLLAPALLPESRDRERARTFDLAGASTITAVLVLLVYAITRVPLAGWGSAVGPLVGAVVLATAFVLIERRSAAPLMPFRILRSRTLVGGNLVVLVAGMAVDGMLITVTAYAQQTLGWSAAHFGLVAAVMTVTAVVGALVGQRCVTKFGIRPVAATGTILLAMACLLFAQGLLVVPLLVFGAGMGGATVAAQIAALSGVAEKESGLAAGLVDTSFAIGTALGVAVCSSIGGQTAFVAAAAFAVAGLVSALTLLRPAPVKLAV